MITAERIKKLLDESNLSYAELEEKLSVSRSSLQRYANGVTNKIPIEVIEKIAIGFNVSPAYLMGWEDDPYVNLFHKVDLSNSMYSLPILGTVPCGTSYEAIEDILGYIEINETLYKRGVRYALIADGNSMDPDIKNGDIMFIKPTPQISSGVIAIVKVNGFEATCKKVLIGESTITLVPSNNEFDIQVFTEIEVIEEPVSIIGEVLSTQRIY